MSLPKVWHRRRLRHHLARSDEARAGCVRHVYLDYNASSPLDPRVLEAMMPFLGEAFGNASSVHRFGRRQAAVVDDAREEVAVLVGGRASGVVFTSSATEANNLALRGVADADWVSRSRILISAVEHDSVAQTANWLSDHGLAKVDVIAVTPSGWVDLDSLESQLGDDVGLVSVMAANSETGVLNDIGAIAESVHGTGALLHCDATQAAGRLTFDMETLGVDLVSISGHKFCGPGGVGALVGTHRGLSQLEALLHGGGHERGLRSGSLNVAGIVGLGCAARIAAEERESESARVGVLRDRLVSELQSRIPSSSQNGDVNGRLPNTASVRFEGADAEAVITNMYPVAVSSGSACSSGSIEPSRVLVAMGLSREAAFESIRFSLGRFTTAEDIDFAVESTIAGVEFVRGMTA